MLDSSFHTKKNFPALTGYRAVAAWMIFVYHFMPFESSKYPFWMKNIIGQFHIGVDMFFVLSGFLITYRYFSKNPFDFRQYMVNRFARIYPMYFLLTIAVFGVWFLQNGYWTQDKTTEAVLSFTMTKALFDKYNLAGIPQGWTLTLEELFYFTAPFYFILIRKNRWWLFLLPILIFIFGTVLKAITNVPQNEAGFLQVNIAVYIGEFFTGMALAYYLLSAKTKNRTYLTFMGILSILLYIFGKKYWVEAFDFKGDFGRFMEMVLLSVFGIAPLLWGLINEKTWVSKFLGSKPMVLLGKSSYIFYLIHKGFVPIFINDYISDNKLVIFILINVLSIFLFRYIEEPLNHYIRQKLGNPENA